MMKVDSRGPRNRARRRRRRFSSGLTVRPERCPSTRAQSRQKRSSHAVDRPAVVARKKTRPMRQKRPLGSHTATPAGSAWRSAMPSMAV